MKSTFAIPRPKRFSRCAAGTLLLALPLSGIALPPSPVQAQPATSLPATPLPAKKSLKPLTVEQKAKIAKLIALSAQERLCKTSLDLKVENATLEEVIAHVKQTTSQPNFEVEVRGARPVRLSFDLQETNVGNILNHSAGLAGCKLWVLPGGLLIAPKAQLTEAENQDVLSRQGGEWAKSTAGGGSSWGTTGQASTLFTRALAQEIFGSDFKNLTGGVAKMTLSEFSPESQAMLQEMGSWLNGMIPKPGAPPVTLLLDPSSPIWVTVSDSPNSVDITVSFKPGTSEPGARTLEVSASLLRGDFKL